MVRKKRISWGIGEGVKRGAGKGYCGYGAKEGVQGGEECSESAVMGHWKGGIEENK